MDFQQVCLYEKLESDDRRHQSVQHTMSVRLYGKSMSPQESAHGARMFRLLLREGTNQRKWMICSISVLLLRSEVAARQQETIRSTLASNGSDTDQGGTQGGVSRFKLLPRRTMLLL